MEKNSENYTKRILKSKSLGLWSKNAYQCPYCSALLKTKKKICWNCNKEFKPVKN